MANGDNNKKNKVVFQKKKDSLDKNMVQSIESKHSDLSTLGNSMFINFKSTNYIDRIKSQMTQQTMVTTNHHNIKKNHV